jgi:hypothetical protein
MERVRNGLIRVVLDVEVDLGFFYEITKGNGASPERSDACGNSGS